MEKKVLTQVSPVVLPWRVKILYAAGSFSKALLAVAMAAFMLYFYTDVCGIDSTVAATITPACRVMYSTQAPSDTFCKIPNIRVGIAATRPNR